jgi:hypothetical protein
MSAVWRTEDHQRAEAGGRSASPVRCKRSSASWSSRPPAPLVSTRWRRGLAGGGRSWDRRRRRRRSPQRSRRAAPSREPRPAGRRPRARRGCWTAPPARASPRSRPRPPARCQAATAAAPRPPAAPLSPRQREPRASATRRAGNFEGWAERVQGRWQLPPRRGCGRCPRIAGSPTTATKTHCASNPTPSCRSSARAPGCSSASTCAASGSVPMPGVTCALRSPSTSAWARSLGPNGRAATLARPARPLAAGSPGPSTSSPHRNCRSRDSSARAPRTARSRSSCSAAQNG